MRYEYTLLDRNDLVLQCKECDCERIKCLSKDAFAMTRSPQGNRQQRR